MKANQKFANADEAVSPVIGVILMVAITVVLAAVVFVLVSNLSDSDSDSAPDVRLQRNEAADRLSVLSADAGATYGQFAFQATDLGGGGATEIRYGIGGTSDGTNGCAVDGVAMKGTTYGTLVADDATCATTGESSLAIGAGQFVGFCADAAATNVELTLVHIESNKVMASYTFATLALCA